MSAIHEKYQSLAYNGVRAWPNFPTGSANSPPMNNTVFVPLQELSFARSFESWGGSPQGECIASVFGADPEL
eukprot:2357373-Rhodomonas_salina.1